jgi:Flp pilus assembly protein TadG
VKALAQAKRDCPLFSQVEKTLAESRSIRGGIWSRIAGICRLFGAGSEGGSLVEFALILPMMMLLITGMFSIGVGINNFMVLTNGVGSGARALALSRGQTVPALAGTDPCAYAVQLIGNATPSLKQSALSYTIVWTPTTGTGGTYTATSTSSSVCSSVSMSSGDTVQVKASYPFTLILMGWRPTSLPMTVQATELVQ